MRFVQPVHVMGILGESEKRVFPVVNQRVKYPGLSRGTQTIDAPRGLSIVSYRAIEHNKFGRSGYDFSLVGDNSVFVNDVAVNSRFKEILDLIDSQADDSKKSEYKQRVEKLKEEASRLSQVTVATNSKLVCNWHCNHDGSFIDQRGGALHLDVEIEFVRSLGTYNIDSVIANLIAAIRGGAGPAELALVD